MPHGEVLLVNTILALNNATIRSRRVESGAGDFTDLGHNLVFVDPEGLFTGPGDIIGVNPNIGPLANNGGPTLTHALLKGSAAIDHGDNTMARWMTGAASNGQ